jgi:hypothetical protein
VTTPTLSPTALYHELNRRFFGGKLPRYRVTFAQARRSGWDGECFPDRRLIQLRRGLAGDELRRSLLHEMCHIGAPGHGRRFLAKLARLVDQGEAWAQEELERYQHTQHTWTDLIAQVKDALEETAYEHPRPRFTVIRSGVANILCCEPGQVLQKVPWLKAAWRNACVRVDRQRVPRRDD